MKIIIEATATTCSITVGSVTRNYKSNEMGAEAIEDGDWEDDIENGKIDSAYQDVLDSFSFLPMDLMAAVSAEEY